MTDAKNYENLNLL